MASFWESSTTYQAIIEEAWCDEVRRILLRLGRKFFGPADKATKSALNAIEDRERLGELTERILDVCSWQELLQPPPRRRQRKPSKRKQT